MILKGLTTTFDRRPPFQPSNHSEERPFLFNTCQAGGLGVCIAVEWAFFLCVCECAPFFLLCYLGMFSILAVRTANGLLRSRCLLSFGSRASGDASLPSCSQCHVILCIENPCLVPCGSTGGRSTNSVFDATPDFSRSIIILGPLGSLPFCMRSLKSSTSTFAETKFVGRARRFWSVSPALSAAPLRLSLPPARGRRGYHRRRALKRLFQRSFWTISSNDQL